MHVNYLAIITGTVLAVLFSSLYYILLNKRVTAIRLAAAEAAKSKNPNVNTTMTPNKMIIELTRTFVLGLVVAYACVLLHVTTLGSAMILAVWLWLGFPVVLLIGSVIHEHFPARLAYIHAGDWLVKLLIFTSLFSMWR